MTSISAPACTKRVGRQLRLFSVSIHTSARAALETDSRSISGREPNSRRRATGSVAGVRSLREWMALLGDPMAVGHPITQEPVAITMDAFAGRDPDSFQLVISWRQYTSVGAAPANLPPVGTPIIEFDWLEPRAE